MRWRTYERLLARQNDFVGVPPASVMRAASTVLHGCPSGLCPQAGSALVLWA